MYSFSKIKGIFNKKFFVDGAAADNEKNKMQTAFKRNIKLIGCFLLSLLAGMFVFALLTGMLNNSGFDITFYQMKSDKIVNPIRIVELTDLHLKEYGEDNIELVEKISSLNPDIITIAGDMNNVYNKDYSNVITLLNSLKEHCDAPIYYAYGNHELNFVYNKDEGLEQAIIDTGAILLKNFGVDAEIAGNKMCIGGLISEYKYYREYYAPDFIEKFQKRDEFKLLLVHYPEYFTEEFHNDLNVDLALCGHTHGGSVRIPGIGPLYAQVQGFFPKLTEGINRYGECSVVVSRGLGGRKIIPRINNRPELVVVDIN